MIIRCAGESSFTLELDPVSQDITVEGDVFSFWCVMPKSVWSDVTASLLEGFLGIAIVDGVRLASLEEREVTDEIRLPTSGTVARMKTNLEKSPLMNKSLLILYRGL